MAKPSLTPSTTPKANPVDKVKGILVDRFKRGLGKAKRIATGTIQNMMGAGARWDKIQADKNENYLSNLNSEKKNK